jgi:TonB family protein
MKLPKDQPFLTSVILHLVVLLGLFLAPIVQAFKPKEPPHVFEMVESPSEQSQSPQPSPQPQAPAELPPVELPPVPEVNIPKPAPRPVDRPKPPEPPKPPAPQQLISADDFFRDNPKPDPTPRPVRPRPSLSVPQIEVPTLVIPSNPNSPSAQLSPQQRSALADYSARLRSRIDAAWGKPEQLAGVNLVAEVIFDVAASGRISNVRISRSSGNAAFDQSILAAFRRATSAGPTPTGQAHQFSLPFRMRD